LVISKTENQRVSRRMYAAINSQNFCVDYQNGYLKTGLPLLQQTTSLRPYPIFWRGKRGKSFVRGTANV